MAKPSQQASNDRSASKVQEVLTRDALLDAVATCIRTHGYAGLSTRKVAEQAGMPLSQIHYHFGSKKNLVLALLKQNSERLLERQRAMYAEELPMWRHWEKACDYYDQDLASGYIRVLQEMRSAGWSDGDIAQGVRNLIQPWSDLLKEVLERRGSWSERMGPFERQECLVMISLLFSGASDLIFLGFEDEGLPVRQTLRKFGTLIRMFEEPDFQV